MKTERLILSFIAILLGLLVAGIGFYLYQRTKIPPPQVKQIVTVPLSPTPSPDSSNMLLIEKPQDEAVVNKRSVTFSGKTRKDATVIVSSEASDQVITPAANGSFSVTHTIDEGTNIVYFTAIFPNGEEKKVIRTITYSTEDF